MDRATPGQAIAHHVSQIFPAVKHGLVAPSCEGTPASLGRGSELAGELEVFQVKEFTKPPSVARFAWPTWLCSAIEADNGLICGMPATWKEHPIASSDLWWLRCDKHHGRAAVPFTGDEPFTVTRLELRVAVPGLGGDRRAAVDEAVRTVTHALQAAGGVIIGLKVPGRRSSEPSPQTDVGRLELAGPPEGQQRGDRPFWGHLDAPDRPAWWKRRKPA